MTAAELEQSWQNDPRWSGIRRPYKADDVVRLRGSVQIEHTLARIGAERLWNLLHAEPYVPALGTLTGNQAVEQIQAGLKAIYVSGWQIAADGNLAGQMYPDQSLYPANSVPAAVRAINAALARADQIQTREGAGDIHWYAPIVADGEAGFGGPLNAFELMKWMIEAGAAGVHFEDQPVAKRGSHGAAVAPIAEVHREAGSGAVGRRCVRVPAVDYRAHRRRSSEVSHGPRRRTRSTFSHRRIDRRGYLGYKGGLDAAIARACAFAPYADLLWCETARPDLEEARKFAEGVHKEFPGKMLAYNCPPSFNWKRKFDEDTINKFQPELGAMGYKFQFVTLAGFHALNHSMFTLAKEYATGGMMAYAKLQEQEFQSAKAHRFPAIKHQRFVGNGYFDDVMNTVLRGLSGAGAMAGDKE